MTSTSETLVKDQPLVSIGVAVYNGERWVRSALDSLLDQTYRNLEIVICDNASTDQTQAICAEYASKDSRVRYLRNRRNIGVRGPNGNYWRVLTHASGEFFMWAAADDVRPRDIVQHCVEAFQRNPRAVMVHGPIQLTFARRAGTVELRNDMDLTSGSEVDRIRTFTHKLQHNAILYGLYRREALLRTRFGNHFGHDYLLCLQTCLLGPVEFVPTPLIRYHQRGNALDGTMYPPEDVTVKDLLWYRGVRRHKCWLTLVVGCGYLLTRRGPRLTRRMAATVAYATSFASRYRRYLLSESVFILVSPLAWLLGPFQPAGTRIKAMLKRRAY